MFGSLLLEPILFNAALFLIFCEFLSALADLSEYCWCYCREL